uniref:Laminin G domain-containing protein n=1 Tax=Ciona savignyi TaxID=51511 RepID=H2YQJ6_CIOSA
VFVGALPVTPSTYRFSGSNSQYCKFPPWGSVQNAHERSILSFQFRTSRENSFLVYLDDGGRSSYIYISLQNRTVRLRYKFGESAPAVLTGGLNLNDNRWHVISVERKYPSITLLVDGQSLAGKVKVKSNSDLVTGSFTYIGSLPKTYRIQTLSFPIAFYEEKFVGSVRQVAINGKFVRTIAKLQVQEVPGNQLCSETRNPCKNNGACFVRGEKQACDCSSTMFKGKFCESCESL